MKPSEIIKSEAGLRAIDAWKDMVTTGNLSIRRDMDSFLIEAMLNYLDKKEEEDAKV